MGSAYAAPIAADLSAVKPGPIAVTSSEQSLTVVWKDAAQHQWQTIFSLDSAKPLITAISADGRLGCIQPVGAAPGAFTQTSSYVYGVGAYLLAGSEIYRTAK